MASESFAPSCLSGLVSPETTASDITIDVVICAYTEKRWDAVLRAVKSVLGQTKPANHIQVVVDHNDDLFDRLSQEFADTEKVTVLRNSESRGLSGARNSGVAACRSEVIAFLDDDAWAAPEWLSEIAELLADPGVVGVGGHVVADWSTGRPNWFPHEFDWIVGCSYEGLPESASPIRNPIGASMAFTAEALEASGGFDHRLGRIGTRPVGCEETEMSMRVREIYGPGSVMYAPDSVVYHTVTDDRATLGYFVRRGWGEGKSKRSVASRLGSDKTLETERTYVTKTLPRGIAKNLGQPGAGWARAAAIVVGTAATGCGYVTAAATGLVDVSGEQ